MGLNKNMYVYRCYMQESYYKVVLGVVQKSTCDQLAAFGH